MNDSSSTQPMGRLERVLMPLATSVGRNKYLLTVRDSFAMIMPLLIIGSMFTLVANFRYPPGATSSSRWRSATTR
ncbi:MAG: hypothetical protein J6D54_10605 [Olsenella sp.]|nr:hypothetical protein [Olsenella sp.]